MLYSTTRLWVAFFLSFNLSTFVAPVSASSNEWAVASPRLIEAAWECNPAFNEQGMAYSIEDAQKERGSAGFSPYRYHQLAFYLDLKENGITHADSNNPNKPNDSVASLILECPEKIKEFYSYDRLMIVDYFVNKYVHFDWVESGIFTDSKFSGTAEQLRLWLTNQHSSITYKFSISDDFYTQKKAAQEHQLALAKEREKKRIDEENRVALEELKKREVEEAEKVAKKEAEAAIIANRAAEEAENAAKAIAAEEAEIAEQAAAAAKKAAEAEALRIRRSKLLDGSIPVSNINDAIVKLDPYELVPIMRSPLLKPDNKFYAGKVEIESAEGESVIYAKLSGFTFNLFGDHYIPPSYAMLRLTKQTRDFSRRGLRIGQAIDVVGRYVQNKPTFKGVGTMPVIEVMYLGN